MPHDFLGFTLDEQLFQLRRGTVEVPLRPQVFDVLRLLVGERHRVVSKEELIREVWKGSRVTDNAVSQCIRELRRALGEGDGAGAGGAIRTVHGRGFRFVAETAEGVQPFPHGWAGQVNDASSRPAFATAVLPFESATGDPLEDELGRGIAESLIRRLATARSIPLIAASSTWAYRRGAASLGATGAALGALYLVEGRVRRVGSRLRVAAHLADTERGTELWSESFDANGDDLFSLEDEIAAAVSSALHPELVRFVASATAALSDDALEGRLLLVRGLSAFYRRSRGDNAVAISYFTRAAQHARSIAPYYLGLAHYYDVYYQWRPDWEAGLAAAAQAAEHCRRTLPGDAAGHMLGGLLHLFSGDTSSARTAAELAVEANPSLAEARGLLGRVLAVSGDGEGSLEQTKIAMRLCPRDPWPADLLAALAIASFVAGRYDESARSAEHAAAHAPHLPSNHLLAAASLALCGDLDRAKRAGRRSRALSAFSPAPFRRLLSSSPPELAARFFEGLRLAGLPVD